MTRLEQEWPEVARELAALDAQQQRQAATRAAMSALDAVGLQTPQGDEDAVEAEVERLDTVAWDLQGDEAAEPGAYELAFRSARATNAYALARFGGSPADAVYEALHALGDLRAALSRPGAAFPPDRVSCARCHAAPRTVASGCTADTSSGAPGR